MESRAGRAKREEEERQGDETQRLTFVSAMMWQVLDTDGVLTTDLFGTHLDDLPDCALVCVTLGGYTHEVPSVVGACIEELTRSRTPLRFLHLLSFPLNHY